MKRTVILIAMVCLVAEVFAGGEPFEVLHRFRHDQGRTLFGPVISDGQFLYGTTIYSTTGIKGGTVFRMALDGSDFRTLKDFDGKKEGLQVYNGLVLLDGTIYGVAKNGGEHGCGTLFRLERDGQGFSVVHAFSGKPSDGNHPYSAPTVHKGKLYGLTYQGGKSNHGTMYCYDPKTQRCEMIHSFDMPGVNPFGSVTSVGDYIYGMTSDHYGKDRFGTIFRYRPSDKTFETIHRFAGKNQGGYPYDSLVWDGGQWLYGTTLGYYRDVDDPEESGVIFRFNIRNRKYEVICDFSTLVGCGEKLNSAMLIGPDGWLYGLAHGTEIWKGKEYGTLYRLQPDGTKFELLHTFGPAGEEKVFPFPGGDVPMRNLIWLDGTLYGTTALGGVIDSSKKVVWMKTRGYGTVWRYRVDPSDATSRSGKALPWVLFSAFGAALLAVAWILYKTARRRQ